MQYFWHEVDFSWVMCSRGEVKGCTFYSGWQMGQLYELLREGKEVPEIVYSFHTDCDHWQTVTKLEAGKPRLLSDAFIQCLDVRVAALAGLVNTFFCGCLDVTCLQTNPPEVKLQMALIRRTNTSQAVPTLLWHNTTCLDASHLCALIVYRDSFVAEGNCQYLVSTVFTYRFCKII